MNRALLDTDIFSEVLKGRNQKVVASARAYRTQFFRYTVCTITIVEVVKGFHKLQRDDRIARFFRALADEEILALDMESAEIAGRIYGDLERTGQTIGRADPMIAGIAIRNSLVLVTGNTDHYERIQAIGYPLQMENWRD
jgi:tRNA(fMet)-specific endonuclease VapC